MENSPPRERHGFLPKPAHWAAAAPLLCAVHCIATPLLVLVAPVLAFEAEVEYAVMAASLAMAIAFLVWGIRLHRQLRVAVPVIAGALLWIGGEATGSHSSAMLILHALGGILLAGGLAWNARLRHEGLCRACGCSAHEEMAEPVRRGPVGTEAAA